MHLTLQTFLPCALVAFTSILDLATAHSWVEAMNVIGPNGAFTGTQGYARGNGK